MAVDYSAGAKSARMSGLRDLVVDGTLEIGTSGFGVVLASFVLTHTGGTVSNGVWSLQFNNNTVPATGNGSAGSARIKDSAGAVQVSGLTVGTSNTDLIVDSLSVSVGQDFTLTSASLTHG